MLKTRARAELFKDGKNQETNLHNLWKLLMHYRGVINGKADKHLPYPNFETTVIL
jgi:hypothetical protein